MTILNLMQALRGTAGMDQGRRVGSQWGQAFGGLPDNAKKVIGHVGEFIGDIESINVISTSMEM